MFYGKTRQIITELMLFPFLSGALDTLSKRVIMSYSIGVMNDFNGCNITVSIQ